MDKRHTARPHIVAIDDEPQVLHAVVRDLRRELGGDYRILSASSGAEALQALAELRDRGASVALLLADQRMPQMEGTDLLTEARTLFPSAKRVLLTAYADTSAAIASINEVGLDHYLLKPWEPPEENLYPVLRDLLDDWRANQSAPFDGIRVAGARWSAPSHAVKDYLARNRIPYRWLDIDSNAEARAMVERATEGKLTLPVVFLPDGTALSNPDRNLLADRLGLHTKAELEFYDLIIIGGGPAGLGAAVYGASEGLRTLLIEREATGGQAGTSARIENYLGFPNGLSGRDLATRAVTRAERLGAELVVAAEVREVEVEYPYKRIRLDNGTELSCYALLVCTGMEVRQMQIDGIDALTGIGVYYGAAVTEASTYRGEEVFIVGGGNSAGQGAIFFAGYAAKVTIVIRRSSLDETMSRYLIDRIEAAPNIEVLSETEVVAVEGTSRLERVVLRDRSTDGSQIVPAAAIFIFIGTRPHSDMLGGLVALDGSGYILTGRDVPDDCLTAGHEPTYLESSVPGIFAAGDVRFGSSKRVAAAVGEGAVAVSQIHQYLNTV